MILSTESLDVHAMVSEVSSKFVTEPTIGEVKNDLLISLKRYCFSVRADARANECSNFQSPKPIPEEFEELGTNLRLMNGWTPDDTVPVKNPVVESRKRPPGSPI